MQRKGFLPNGQLVGSMIQAVTPSGNKINYPAKLAQRAIQHDKYGIFTTADGSGNGWIVITQPDRVRFRLGGSPESISKIYESIPWTEKVITDSNGVFTYKEAPSLDALEEVLAQYEIV